MSDRQLQNILNFFAIMIFVLAASCEIESCDYVHGTFVTKDKPTNHAITADVHCSFFVGDWNAGKNKKTGVKVNPKTSKYVELQFNLRSAGRNPPAKARGRKAVNVEGGQPSQFGVNCETYFK